MRSTTGSGVVCGWLLWIGGRSFGPSKPCVWNRRFHSWKLVRSSPRCAGQPDPAAHGADEVGAADLHPGPREADGAHDQTHRPLLPGEDMLDPGAHLGLRRIGAGGPLRQRLALRLAPVNAAGGTGLGEMRLVLRRAIGSPLSLGPVANRGDPPTLIAPLRKSNFGW